MRLSYFLPSNMLRPLTYICLVIGSLIMGAPAAVTAQSTENVTVNLSVLDAIDPATTAPRLLMPSIGSARGRIVLTPPTNSNPIIPQQTRIVLRPPTGVSPRMTKAPTIAVPSPAAPAIAPPRPVTPSPAPSRVEATPEPVVSRVPGQAQVPAPMPQESITSTDKLAADTDRAENKEIASLPDAKESEEPSTPLSITFGAEETNLPTLAKPKLNVLVKQMKADETLRLQLMAYAGSADESPSSVRRKSLSRALSVREFLMDQGVQSTRIEVRALGNNNDGGMPDRVDAVIQER